MMGRSVRRSARTSRPLSAPSERHWSARPRSFPLTSATAASYLPEAVPYSRTWTNESGKKPGCRYVSPTIRCAAWCSARVRFSATSGCCERLRLNEPRCLQSVSEEVSPCRGACQEVRGSRILRGLEKGRRRAEHGVLLGGYGANCRRGFPFLI